MNNLKMLGRRAALAAGSAAVIAMLAGTQALSAPGASVTVTSLNGVAPVAGANRVTGKTLNVNGTAAALPAMDADAGPSLYVKQGDTPQLFANAYFAVAPTSFAWTLDGSSAAFVDATKLQPVLKTAGLADGVHDAALRVSDSRGISVTRHTRVVTYSTTATTLADARGTIGPVLPVTAGPITPQTASVPFDVAPNTTSLLASLHYDPNSLTPASPQSEPVFGAMDLTLTDPAGHQTTANGLHDSDPAPITIANPLAGHWTETVTDNGSNQTTYELKASSTGVTVGDPRPSVSAGGPYSFTVGDPQVLAATTAGGVAPVKLSWDLSQDGHFAALGASPTTSFGIGSHVVTVRAVDAAGFDSRDTTAVRIAAPGSTGSASPIVVVALSDTGINPYHQDWSAATYPDKAVLARSKQFTADPATYVPGYPAGTPSLNITLGQGYNPAADAALWSTTAGTTKLNTLYWIPGTKIIGAMDSGLGDGATGVTDPPAYILDTNGHGTASASVLAGNTYGSCSRCLVVAIKGLGATWAYSQPWIDVVSNSFGAEANVGTPLVGSPAFPQASAERGQIALYAAGNGNEDAFVTPEQTYTSNDLGPDWVIRIGAVDRSSRQPIIGTGKPVSASSFGIGDIPAAAYNSTGGQVQHNGTSAATPISAGVFGQTLLDIRAALGDGGVGQRPGAVIAQGTPVAGSPYLSDGVLTRAELVQAVLDTATRGSETSSIGIYPPTTPGSVKGNSNPAQYVVQGRGIIEPPAGTFPGSGIHAENVLLGKEALPTFGSEEDQFYSQDSQLRQQLWGTWAGGGANSAYPGSGPSSAANPFAGVTASQVTDFASAMSLIQKAQGAPAAAPADPSAPTASLSSPLAGYVAPVGATSLAVSGGVDYPPVFYLRRDGCGTAADNTHLSRDPGTADTVGCTNATGPLATTGCGTAPDPAGLGLCANAEEYPVAAADLPLVLDGASAITGTINVSSAFLAPSPQTTIDIALTSGGTVINHVAASGSVPANGGTAPFNFSMPVPAAYSGVTLSKLSVVMSITQAEAPVAFSLNKPNASFISLPAVSQPVPAGAAVQVSVDDPGFTKPTVLVVQPDFTFSGSTSIAGLSPAPAVHTLYARALRAGNTGAPQGVKFQVAAAVTGPPPPPPPPPVAGMVQVQLVRLGVVPSAAGWLNATDGAGDGTFSTWAATIDMSKLRRGTYTLWTRILLSDGTVVSSSPITIRR